MAQQPVLNQSSRYNPMGLRYDHEEYKKVAELGLKPHDLRHPNKAHYLKSV